MFDTAVNDLKESFETKRDEIKKSGEVELQDGDTHEIEEFVTSFKNSPPEELRKYIREQFQQTEVKLEIKVDNMGTDNQITLATRNSNRDEFHDSVIDSFDSYWNVSKINGPGRVSYALSSPNNDISTFGLKIN